MPRFAIKTPPQHCTWSDVLEIWKQADEIEIFEAAWVFDHFYPIMGDPHGPCMEGWSTLAALAQATERLRIGCMVTGMHYRHPAITASMAASIDIISNGRLDLGLGAGWNELESNAYGITLGTLRERMDRFEEGVEVIARLLSQETTTFSGSHYQLTEARCEPKGLQQPRIPITIGGAGERRTLRTVARWAQMWDAIRVPPEEWPLKYEVLVGHCEAVGRDPAEITCSAHIPTDPDADPRELAERAHRFFEAGVDVVVFSLRPPNDPSIVEPLAHACADIA